MDILGKILETKKQEVETRKRQQSIAELENSKFYSLPAYSLAKALLSSKTGIIAEFKRRSPSKGEINARADSSVITPGYVNAGASALSILTDEMHFKGSNADLLTARNLTNCPILRKDFVIDEFQVIEAKSIGADAILLIATALSKRAIERLTKLATSLGMEVLLEVHQEKELEKWNPDIKLVGVNNRNLKTFMVSISQSIELFDKLPSESVKIAESGIRNSRDHIILSQMGYNGFLIGESFMKSTDPTAELRKLINDISENK